ncbi:MAG: hypothetical protein ACXWKP_03885 [Bradyrhizobium sp.]
MRLVSASNSGTLPNTGARCLAFRVSQRRLRCGLLAITLGYVTHFDLGFPFKEIRCEAVIIELIVIDYFGKKPRRNNPLAELLVTIP